MGTLLRRVLWWPGSRGHGTLFTGASSCRQPVPASHTHTHTHTPPLRSPQTMRPKGQGLRVEAGVPVERVPRARPTAEAVAAVRGLGTVLHCRQPCPCTHPTTLPFHLQATMAYTTTLAAPVPPAPAAAAVAEAPTASTAATAAVAAAAAAAAAPSPGSKTGGIDLPHFAATAGQVRCLS